MLDNIQVAQLCLASSKIRLEDCFGRLIDGVFLEFGVATGGTTREIARLNPTRKIYGFDWFRGLPEKWHRDADAGLFACEPPRDLPGNVELVEGLFQETLAPWLKQHPEPVAFVHIDCDLYSSTIFVLRALRDRLEDGTVIVFDEIMGPLVHIESEGRALADFINETNLCFECIGHWGGEPFYQGEKAAFRLTGRQYQPHEEALTMNDLMFTGEKLQLAFSPEIDHGDDADLIRRIAAAYKLATAEFGGHGNSMWAGVSRHSASVLENLLGSNADSVTRRIFRYPAEHDLLLGFDEACKTHADMHRAASAMESEIWARRILYKLHRLAEAVGATRVHNPESQRPPTMSIAEVLDALDQRLGFRLDFPNPYPGEYGLVTPRGIADHRTVIAVYQAWRLSTLANGPCRVLEIGAGVGRTAYYARKFGITDYTIVDLPHTCAAQANWLGRVLGPQEIVLAGERSLFRGMTRVVGPRWLLNSPGEFDVVLNGDSITEIDPGTAADYFRVLASRAKVLVSINHEANQFCTRDLPAMAGVVPACVLRFPFWAREGYVEELFFFN
jgi:SAM-dependent methyltransferase